MLGNSLWLASFFTFGCSVMLIGFARVSTGDQSLTLQIEALEEAGCDRVFQYQVSGIVNTRPNLNQAPNFVTLSRLQQETRS